MKKLTTYISHVKDLHSLNEYLNEKLIINQRFDEKLIINQNYKTASNKLKEFFNIGSVKYSRSATEDFKKERALYYDILKFIADNKDDMKFFYINEQTTNGDYLIYLFETGKIKVAVWGHKKIVDTNRSTIVFQYIK